MFRRFSKIYPCIVIAAGSGLFLFPCQAHAYLDPGTGSMILQGIIGGLAAVAVVAKLYWHRLLRFFRIKQDSSCDVEKSNPHENTHIKTSDSQKLNK